MVSSCRLTPAWAASALEVRWDSGLATSESQGPREVSSTGDCGLWGEEAALEISVGMMCPKCAVAWRSKVD